MKLSPIALALLVQQVAANKKSKAGSASEIVTSCPNFSGSSMRSGGSKQSKGGFAAGTSDCGSGTTTTVNCGDTFDDENIFLLKDLVCNDGAEDTITLRGNSVLDCGGRSIVGFDGDDEFAYILELYDNASVINCNFIRGENAIRTLGDGCITIENVSIYDSKEDAIRTRHSGTVVLRDVSVFSAGEDGIDIEVGDEDALHAILDNVRVLDSNDDGIELSSFNAGGGDIVADFYGNIFSWGNRDENLRATNNVVDTDITVFGNLFAGESDEQDGIDFEDGNTITFAAGSFSEICDNASNDIEFTTSGGPEGTEGRVFVEEGAVVICDDENPSDDNLCTDSCEVDEALACIE